MVDYPKCNIKTTHTPNFWRILFKKSTGFLHLEDWTYRKVDKNPAHHTQTTHGRIVGSHKYEKRNRDYVWFVLCESKDKDTDTKSYHWVNLSSNRYDNTKYFTEIDYLSLDEIMTKFSIPLLP